MIIHTEVDVSRLHQSEVTKIDVELVCNFSKTGFCSFHWT